MCPFSFPHLCYFRISDSSYQKVRLSDSLMRRRTLMMIYFVRCVAHSAFKNRSCQITHWKFWQEAEQRYIQRLMISSSCCFCAEGPERIFWVLTHNTLVSCDDFSCHRLWTRKFPKVSSLIAYVRIYMTRNARDREHPAPKLQNLVSLAQMLDRGTC